MFSRVHARFQGEKPVVLQPPLRGEANFQITITFLLFRGLSMNGYVAGERPFVATIPFSSTVPLFQFASSAVW